MAVEIDFGLMMCAIEDGNSFIDETAYLHRGTGEIVFLYEEELCAEIEQGMDVVVDSVFDRARVDAAPDEWLEIPKLDEADGEAFMKRFFDEHGIDAKLV